MSRTLGAKDLRKRKIRSDKGKPLKTYRGKPTKKKRKNIHGNFVPYVPKRKPHDPLKIWFFQKKAMSYDGYRRFPRKIRPYVRKIVFCPVGKPVLVNPTDISNKEKLGQVAIDVIGFDGSFDFRMPTKRKNKHHVSYCKKADIKITEHPDGLIARVSGTWKLNRYWFWKDE